MKNAKFLKSALLGNALFSITAGLFILLKQAYWQQLFGITFPLWWIGAGLLPFAAWVIWEATKDVIDTRQVKLIVWADCLWVLGSLVLLLLNLGISTAGNWIIIGLALVVADFALLQSIGLKKLKAS